MCDFSHICLPDRDNKGVGEQDRKKEEGERNGDTYRNRERARIKMSVYF